MEGLDTINLQVPIWVHSLLILRCWPVWIRNASSWKDCSRHGVQCTNDVVVGMQSNWKTATSLCALPTRTTERKPGSLRSVQTQEGQEDAFSLVAFSECSSALNWEKSLSDYTCRSWHAEMICCYFFCSSAPEKSILMQMLAEMYKGWQVFSRGMLWLKLKYLYYLRSFLRYKGAGTVICLSQELLEAAACFFEPTKPEVGDKIFWGINNLVIIGQPLLWAR